MQVIKGKAKKVYEIRFFNLGWTTPTKYLLIVQ